MLVEVRPITEKKWHNKKGKESFSMPKVLEALYDQETGKYATGLSEAEAAHYSKLTGFDLSDTFMHESPHPFWSTKPAMVKLENLTMIFDTSRPIDFIKVKLMKASKLVANSLKEYNEGKWPDAIHVIFDENEEVSIKASRQDLKDQCVLVKMKMSDDDKANIIMVLSKRLVRGRSTDFLNVELASIIENEPEQFLKYARMGRENIYAEASILEAIHRNFLTKEAGAVFYMGDMIGTDLAGAVEWFKNPQHQKMKVALLNKLTGNNKVE